MPSQDLLNTFMQLLKESKSFNYLPIEQQSLIKAEFLVASDTELSEGIAALKEDAVNMQKIEAANEERIKNVVRATMELKETLKQVEKAEIAGNNEKDRQNSAQVADSLLSSLDSEEDNTKGKKKSFWG